MESKTEEPRVHRNAFNNTTLCGKTYKSMYYKDSVITGSRLPEKKIHERFNGKLLCEDCWFREEIYVICEYD